MPIEIAAGETKRCQCDACQVEFEITFEPKVAEMSDPDAQRVNIPNNTVIACPFCNQSELQEC